MVQTLMTKREGKQRVASKCVEKTSAQLQVMLSFAFANLYYIILFKYYSDYGKSYLGTGFGCQHRKQWSGEADRTPAGWDNMQRCDLQDRWAGISKIAVNQRTSVCWLDWRHSDLLHDGFHRPNKPRYPYCSPPNMWCRYVLPFSQHHLHHQLQNPPPTSNIQFVRSSPLPDFCSHSAWSFNTSAMDSSGIIR